MPQALQMHPKDNVAVCTSAVRAGDTVEVLRNDGSRFRTIAVTDITYCNKIALSRLAPGDAVLKYGEQIGEATEAIPQGSLVNDRNIRSRPRAYADEYLCREKSA